MLRDEGALNLRMTIGAANYLLRLLEHKMMNGRWTKKGLDVCRAVV